MELEMSPSQMMIITAPGMAGFHTKTPSAVKKAPYTRIPMPVAVAVAPHEGQAVGGLGVERRQRPSAQSPHGDTGEDERAGHEDKREDEIGGELADEDGPSADGADEEIGEGLAADLLADESAGEEEGEERDEEVEVEGDLEPAQELGGLRLSHEGEPGQAECQGHGGQGDEEHHPSASQLPGQFHFHQRHRNHRVGSPFGKVFEHGVQRLVSRRSGSPCSRFWRALWAGARRIPAVGGSPPGSSGRWCGNSPRPRLP